VIKPFCARAVGRKNQLLGNDCTDHYPFDIKCSLKLFYSLSKLVSFPLKSTRLIYSPRKSTGPRGLERAWERRATSGEQGEERERRCPTRAPPSHTTAPFSRFSLPSNHLYHGMEILPFYALSPATYFFLPSVASPLAFFIPAGRCCAELRDSHISRLL
jgi:hypothetical protein